MEGKFSGKAQDGSHQYTEMTASPVRRVGSIGLTVAWICEGISGMIQRCSTQGVELSFMKTGKDCGCRNLANASVEINHL